MIQAIDNIIERFRSEGVILTREPESFSLGTFDECRKMLYHGIKHLDKTVTEVTWLPQYDEVAKWMSDTEGKGLFLRGSCGVGKTLLLNLICIYFRIRINKVIFPINAMDLVEVERKDLLARKFYALDDIGIEPTRNDYGEKEEMFSTIVDDAEKKSKLLLITTNLRASAIKNRYGQRTLDRICHVCKIVKFTKKVNIEENGKTVTKEVDLGSLRK